jgi:serine/threonine protein kinase
MSAPAVEPGTKLADRFRLEDRVAEQGGATLWKAIDEVLARPVAVYTFSAEFPRTSEVVTAARSASRLSDPRLTQVFDAAEEDGRSYVVSEWVTGETLADMVSSGPLDPERAAALVAEAAEALVHAHEAGLYHLCLTPDRLIWTSGSTVKVLGLGVDAALAELDSDDPGRADAEGLGRLLYAGLTGHWPGDDETGGGLPPAPTTDGHFCSPRQVTAGVPGYLDTVVCRAVLPEARRLQPLVSPAEMVDALGGVPRPAPVPVSAVPPSVPPPPDDDVRFEMTRPPDHARTMAPQQWRPSRYEQIRRGGMANRVVMTAVVLLVMAAVGLGAWSLGRSIGGSPDDTSAKATPKVTATVEPKIIKPESATGFDPLSVDKVEKPQYARFAIDSKKNTEWHTDTYTSADLGRLKDGVGLLLDMGDSVKVSEVITTLSKAPGATVELRVGDSRDLDSLKTVAREKNASGKVTLKPEATSSGQYVLIWFTRLPADQGSFRGTIYDVVVYSPGTA